MSSLQKKSCVVGGCVLLWLAGCAQPPTDVKITRIGSSPAAAAPATPAMPSYPILLVDLPRQQAGLPVPPARSRLPAGSERDAEWRPPSGAGAAPSPGRTPARAVAPIASPASARPAPGTPSAKDPEPIDTRFVP